MKYLPYLFTSTKMAFSFSSETITQTLPQLSKVLMHTSLEMMSNFFYWSPVVFSPPAKPNKLAIPAFFTFDAMYLQAV
jgi:hypothetical protein